VYCALVPCAKPVPVAGVHPGVHDPSAWRAAWYPTAALNVFRQYVPRSANIRASERRPIAPAQYPSALSAIESSSVSAAPPQQWQSSFAA
jgi:hypothetical protein